MKHVVLYVVVLMLLSGCIARQRREQYYLVVERAEGTGAIFKATATLSGWGGRYKLNEGYVPVNVIDALSGKIGEPPDLFSPVSHSQRQAELNDQLEVKRADALLKLSEDAGALNSGKKVDERMLRIDNVIRVFGALKSAASMSANEQISIGQSGSTDVYAYRKLVFYVSLQVIKMKEFENELNELEKSTSDLAKAFVQAKQAKAEAAKAKAQQLGAMRTSVLGQINNLLTTKPDAQQWNAQDVLGIFAPIGLGGAS